MNKEVSLKATQFLWFFCRKQKTSLIILGLLVFIGVALELVVYHSFCKLHLGC